jgi:hypothetical protein
MATAEAGETISILGAGGDGAAVLYTVSDFFLCADAAPGLCLPLVQATQAGLPIVTTMSASILSFLPQDAAVPIAIDSGPLDHEDEEKIDRFLPLTFNLPKAAALRDAVLTAVALDDDARFRMVDNGWKAAERRFSLAAFKTGLDQLGAFVSLGTP